MSQPPSIQNGAALVIALLLVLIVVSLSVSVMSDFKLMFRKVEAHTHGQQAYAYLVGAEGVGRQMVLDDAGTSIDHLSEGWLDQPMLYANDHAQFTGIITDVQGRLNINNLQSATPQGGGQAVYTTNQQRFIRLLQTLALEIPLRPLVAEEIANSVFDWLDIDDNERSPGGAESLYYGDAVPPGRAANQQLASVSELRWVNGITPEIYQALLPHITIWGEGTININTATENVLRSLNKNQSLVPLEVMDVAVILERQQDKDQGFENINVLTEPPLASFNIDVADLGVSSDVFMQTTQVLMLERIYQLKSIIRRDENSAVVIARSQNNF